AAGIPTWSPTVVLICRSTAYVWQSGRDAQFSADCGLFTALAVYWGHLEYRVKVLMPWKLMSNKPQPAGQSVLLDYVSPMQPVVLLSSARASHWPVLTAAIGSILIIVMTVVSTSLFVLEQTVLEQDQVPMTVSSRINDSSFDQNVIDSSPVLSALTIISGNLSMEYPLGTNQQFATDVFSPSKEAVGISSLLKARVNVTTSDLDCRHGNITHSQFLAEENYLQVDVSDGSCQSGQLNVTVANSNDTISWLFQTTASCPDKVTQMILGFVKFKIPPYTGSDQFMDETVNETPRAMNSSSINSTILFCEPRYSFENADVTFNSTNIQSITNQTTVATSASAMSGKMMIDGFQNALMSAKVSINSLATDFDVLLDALLAVSSSRTVDRYEDPANLESDTRQLYSAVCAQIVHQYMRATTSDMVMGTQWVEKSRLVLNELSLRLLEAGIAMLIVSTMIMSLVRPSIVGLGGLPTLGRVSAILARSDTFETALKGRGAQRAESMAEHLSSGFYSVRDLKPSDESGLCIQRSFPANEEATADREDMIRWWLPFALAACPNITLAHTNVTAHPPTMIGVACRYRVEQVPANLTYDLHEGVPSDAQPIGEGKVLDGYTPRCLQNPTNFEQIMDPSSLAGYSYARLMLAALNGSDPSTMLTSENLPILVDRVTQICNTFTTQYFSDKLRSDLYVAATVPATLSGSATRACVYQDRTSTTVLEVLLAVIFVCTITALWLFDAEQLIPKDPCSITAQASLVAGAEFLRLIPPGSQALSNTKIAQLTPFKDHLFSIGWWTQEDGTRRFGIDTGQAEPEEQCKDEKTAVDVTDVELGEFHRRSMDHEQEENPDHPAQAGANAGTE
ncbi:hypothetical protein KCU95_g11132, partial [Aureobasidium melanogenum]